MVIEALMESADFEPDGRQSSYVTVTLRVPRDTKITPGIYNLEWQRHQIPMPAWAKAHDDN